jgi:transcriptional regulator with XRE-family HTH domain
MDDREPITTQLLQFLARTAAAREARGFNQTKMAKLLNDDMEQGTYSKYETRSPLPHQYIVRFVEFCGVDYEWLFTGQGKGPPWKKQFDELVAKQTAEKRRRRRAA